MYVPEHFSETDLNEIEAVIQDNGFGLLVSVVDGQTLVSHVPFLYDRAGGRLLAHLARANPQWETLASATDVMAVFQGPHAYVSPTWYQQPGGVPTWNYVAVHVRGTPRVFDDPQQLHEVVRDLSTRYEAINQPPWNGEYNRGMLGAIVGVEILISDIQAQFKLSQNRAADDRASVIEKLGAEAPSEAQRLAAMMQK